MKEVLEVSGAVFTLLGGLIGAYGTYFVTKWYHPFQGLDFMGSLIAIAARLFLGRKRAAIAEIQAEATFGELNKEQKAESLFGAYLVLIGFAVQSAGALLLVAVAVWSAVEKAHAAS